MAKLHGTDVNLDDPLAQGLRNSLIEKKHIIKKDDEYFWTMKSMKDLEKAIRRLNRSLNNPLWKFYYSFFKW
ncbi:hypothetical protein K8R30_03500 [archaeon]|nr:hypothetical protein [archaeon]